MEPDAEFPPGWYPDPDDPAHTRWWDGEAWGERPAPLPPVQTLHPAIASKGGAADTAQPAPKRRTSRGRSAPEVDRRTVMLVALLVAIAIAAAVYHFVLAAPATGTA